jgi:tripartite-type tricarboxylate transporter receptor subunit TctC
VVELGYPALVAENFVGISGPAGLSEEVSRSFEQAVDQVLKMPDIQAKLQQMGFVLASKNRVQFTDFVRQQSQSWAPVVKLTGATL